MWCHSKPHGGDGSQKLYAQYSGFLTPTPASVKVPSLSLYNGKKIPVIGLGTWKSKPNEVSKAVKDAIDIGYRHIDCAHIYQNEKEVGEGINTKINEGKVKRENLFITSKLWCTFHHPDLVEQAIQMSLDNLQLQYLDLYLIHWPQAYKEGGETFPADKDGRVIPSNVDIVDTWKAMETLVTKGLTKSIGVSNFNKRQLEKIIKNAKIKPMVNQIECHPYLNQIKLIDFCKSQGMVVIASSPLGSPDRPWARCDDPKLSEDQTLMFIADMYKKTVPQLLIRYAIDRGMVVIPKSVNKAHIVENFNVFDFELESEDIKEIGRLECNGRLCSMGDTHHPEYPFHYEY